jgi:hypothetical protein
MLESINYIRLYFHCFDLIMSGPLKATFFTLKELFLLSLEAKCWRQQKPNFIQNKRWRMLQKFKILMAQLKYKLVIFVQFKWKTWINISQGKKIVLLFCRHWLISQLLGMIFWIAHHYKKIRTYHNLIILN